MGGRLAGALGLPVGRHPAGVVSQTVESFPLHPPFFSPSGLLQALRLCLMICGRLPSFPSSERGAASVFPSHQPLIGIGDGFLQCLGLPSLGTDKVCLPFPEPVAGQMMEEQVQPPTVVPVQSDAVEGAGKVGNAALAIGLGVCKDPIVDPVESARSSAGCAAEVEASSQTDCLKELRQVMFRDPTLHGLVPPKHAQTCLTESVREDWL